MAWQPQHNAGTPQPPPELYSRIKSLVQEAKIPPDRETRVVRDVYDACRFRPSLQPCLKPDTLEGSREQLLVLDGTVPIKYKEATYQIPIMIFLKRLYPNEPPVSYVNPTSTMVVRPGQNVNKDGLIVLPYYLCSGWDPLQYNLHGLTNAMINVFSKNPPLSQVSSSSHQLQQKQHRYVHGQFQRQQQPIYRGAAPLEPQYNAGHQQFQQFNQHQHQQQIKEEKGTLVGTLSTKLSERFKDYSVEGMSEMITYSEKLGKLTQSQNETSKTVENYEKLKKQYQSLQKEHDSLQQWNDMNINENVNIENDVDIILQFRDMIIHQMADCEAKNEALKDTMDEVDEAFVKNVIDNHQYIKHIRALSRDQFKPRALKKNLEIQYIKAHHQKKEAAKKNSTKLHPNQNHESVYTA